MPTNRTKQVERKANVFHIQSLCGAIFVFFRLKELLIGICVSNKKYLKYLYSQKSVIRTIISYDWGHLVWKWPRLVHDMSNKAENWKDTEWCTKQLYNDFRGSVLTAFINSDMFPSLTSNYKKRLQRCVFLGTDDSLSVCIDPILFTGSWYALQIHLKAWQSQWNVKLDHMYCHYNLGESLVNNCLLVFQQSSGKRKQLDFVQYFVDATSISNHAIKGFEDMVEYVLTDSTLVDVERLMYFLMKKSQFALLNKVLDLFLSEKIMVERDFKDYRQKEVHFSLFVDAWIPEFSDKERLQICDLPENEGLIIYDDLLQLGGKMEMKCLKLLHETLSINENSFKGAWKRLIAFYKLDIIVMTSDNHDLFFTSDSYVSKVLSRKLKEMWWSCI